MRTELIVKSLCTHYTPLLYDIKIAYNKLAVICIITSKIYNYINNIRTEIFGNIPISYFTLMFFPFRLILCMTISNTSLTLQYTLFSTPPPHTLHSHEHNTYDNPFLHLRWTILLILFFQFRLNKFIQFLLPVNSDIRIRRCVG